MAERLLLVWFGRCPGSSGLKAGPRTLTAAIQGSGAQGRLQAKLAQKAAKASEAQDKAREAEAKLRQAQADAELAAHSATLDSADLRQQIARQAALFTCMV